MLTDILLVVLWFIPRAVISILPSGSIFPAAVNDAVVAIVQSALKFNEFFPVLVLLQALGIVLSVEAVILGIKLFQFVLSFVRGYKATK